MTAEARPDLVVVRGAPTDEEVAALVVALAGLSRPAPRSPTPVNSDGWSAYWRSVRMPLHPGPGAWRGAARP